MANIDPRSLRVNYEVGVEIYDEMIGKQISHYAMYAIQQSSLVTQEVLNDISSLIKIRDGIAWLFSPYL